MVVENTKGSLHHCSPSLRVIDFSQCLLYKQTCPGTNGHARVQTDNAGGGGGEGAPINIAFKMTDPPHTHTHTTHTIHTHTTHYAHTTHTCTHTHYAHTHFHKLYLYSLYYANLHFCCTKERHFNVVAMLWTCG